MNDGKIEPSDFTLKQTIVICAWVTSDDQNLQSVENFWLLNSVSLARVSALLPWQREHVLPAATAAN